MVNLILFAVPGLTESGGRRKMPFWQILALVVTGAGTLASILGGFFGIYAKENGKRTREFIAAENKSTREFIAVENKSTREFIAVENKSTREFIAAENKSTREFTAEQNQVLARVIREGFEKVILKLEQA